MCEAGAPTPESLMEHIERSRVLRHSDMAVVRIGLAVVLGDSDDACELDALRTRFDCTFFLLRMGVTAGRRKNNTRCQNDKAYVSRQTPLMPFLCFGFNIRCSACAAGRRGKTGSRRRQRLDGAHGGRRGGAHRDRPGAAAHAWGRQCAQQEGLHCASHGRAQRFHRCYP